ncbi:MAG: LPS export ABC transporter ATP-binding protein [Gammaproteobacteria bacterium]
MQRILKAESISKSYKKKLVLNHIDLKVKSGEIVGLLGPNGAGKTTCFYTMLGLVGLDSGRILLDDLDISKLPVHSRASQGLAYLPQEASIFRKLSVKDNILAILETREDLNTEERQRLLNRLLKEFQLETVADTLGISLSGGERRRTEIARSLALEPAFMFLDEPFAGVDPISILDIKQMIRSLSSRNIGIIITDHNVRETLDICDRAYILHKAHVIAQGSPETVLENPQVREVYLGEDFRL